MRRVVFGICLLAAGLFLSSCGSSKRLSDAARQREELSRQFGFKLSKKDDIRLYRAASGWLGVPYRPGGTTRQGVDCSGLMNNLYREVYGESLSRTTEGILKDNCRKVGKGSLREGDFVFFNTSRKKRKGVNHVGLFLKHGYFIHATTSKGVMVNHLKEDYYRKAWKTGGRKR